MSRHAVRSRHQQEGRPSGSSIPGRPTSYKHAHTGEGSMEKAGKLFYKPQGLQSTRIREGTRNPYHKRRTEPRRALLAGMNTSSSLHARSTTPGHHARPSSSPETHKGEKRGGRGCRREREKGRKRERGKGSTNRDKNAPPRALRQRDRPY
ncbi:hypothetical protein Taro_052690 [Colocasia esculenta]|uniref:Uncharacterized protein n=1 Tax=Colocasia esculenta TaxID=4460 RepID=A0A843XKE1_COLES|nr:hypothetical protein [Colocasia esculenta]